MRLDKTIVMKTLLTAVIAIREGNPKEKALA